MTTHRVTSMENARAKLGSSLKVPSVHDLAKQNPASVPPRYLRPDQDPPFSTIFHPSCCSSAAEIPVIDLQILLSGGDRDCMNSELQKLDFACKEWGFFQLINHGVSSSLLDKVKLESERFFNLPMEEKKRFEQEADDLEGFRQTLVASEEEQKHEWADMFYVVTQPTHLRKPHLFPNLPTPFREALEEYSSELKNLAMKILTQMATALGMKMEEMSVLFGEGIQAMRMNHYPPCPEPDMVIGLRPHSDVVALTILLQVSEVEGLQVRKDGAWIPVVPLPNAFIINIGDILEMVTNGTYKSVEHRATVNGEKERISIATFLNLKLDEEIVPSSTLVTPENPARYKRISMADYFRGFFARKRDGKSYIDAMKV